jgi:hypothetical protein
LYVDEALVDIRNWSGSQIIIDVDYLSLGTHNLTLVVFDNMGKSASDTVFVEVIDTIGPAISVSRIPKEPTIQDDVIIIAEVTDASDVSHVILSYSLDGGLLWTNVTMMQEETEWTGEIPPQMVGIQVRYKVYSNDTLGNWAISRTWLFEVKSTVTTTTTSTSTTTVTSTTTTSITSMTMTSTVTSSITTITSTTTTTPHTTITTATSVTTTTTTSTPLPTVTPSNDIIMLGIVSGGLVLIIIVVLVLKKKS